MADNAFTSGIAGRHPLIQLIISLLIITVTGMVLSVLIIAGTGLLLNISFEEMIRIPAVDTDQRHIYIVKFVQVTQQVAMMLVPSLIIGRLLKNSPVPFLKTDKSFSLLILVSLILLAILVIPVTTYAGQVNSGISLPERFSGISSWMRERENEADQITSLMVESAGILSLVGNIFIIAVVPAVSEEFLFRGVLQQLFVKVFRSAHAGIWISAIIFSSVHLQFYGFIPRLLLGLLFGYLFYWSGSIWVPVTAHFANNCLLTIAANMERLKPEAVLTKPDESLLTGFPYIPVILSCIVLYYLWHEFRRSGEDARQ
jgi:uncharacterized protein